MTRIPFIICSVLFFTTSIAGCGSGGKSESTKSPQAQESKMGTRSNPVQFKKSATIDVEALDDDLKGYPGKVEMSVTEVVRGVDAQQKLKGMDDTLEETPDGYEWVLLKVKVKVVELSTKDHPFVIDEIQDFGYVSDNGDVYSGDVVAMAKPGFDLIEMYKGSEKEGYVAGLVVKGQGAKVKYAGSKGDVFFNLK